MITTHLWSNTISLTYSMDSKSSNCPFISNTNISMYLLRLKYLPEVSYLFLECFIKRTLLWWECSIILDQMEVVMDSLSNSPIHRCPAPTCQEWCQGLIIGGRHHHHLIKDTCLGQETWFTHTQVALTRCIWIKCKWCHSLEDFSIKCLLINILLTIKCKCKAHQIPMKLMRRLLVELVMVKHTCSHPKVVRIILKTSKLWYSTLWWAVHLEGLTLLLTTCSICNS